MEVSGDILNKPKLDRNSPPFIIRKIKVREDDLAIRLKTDIDSRSRFDEPERNMQNLQKIYNYYFSNARKYIRIEGGVKLNHSNPRRK